jgi:murein DD-endopeptidase MepM/ murein hydrolase activator NlpD
MQNHASTIHLIFTDQVKTKLQLFITYFLSLLFVALTWFVSISVKNYMTSSMFMTLIESEIDDNVKEIAQTQSMTITVQKKDNLQAIFLKQGLPQKDISKITALLKNRSSGVLLKTGQQITFYYDIKLIENDMEDLIVEERVLSKIKITRDKLHYLHIVREGNDFIVHDNIIPLNVSIVKMSAIVNSNFMSALRSLGINNHHIIELINAYSHQVDFQRQIQPGDIITIISEKFITDSGELSHYGKIIHASLSLSGKKYDIYRYSDDGSKTHSFFSEDGKSVIRSMLKTPINITRISSHYGNRKDPTLGFTKMHKGVDFAAPEGTPIYASGDGTVCNIGWKSGYGKVVQIRHSSTLSTLYAHANSFAKGLKIGQKVARGQVIAYVGRTGRTTGAHLHYEVKIDGKNVNPMSIKTTPSLALKGKRLVKFYQFQNIVKGLHTQLDNNLEIAKSSINALNLK